MLQGWVWKYKLIEYNLGTAGIILGKQIIFQPRISGKNYESYYTFLSGNISFQ
jgi:hypothetical protein